MSDIGIAVFVKTPNLSPVKTRLAKSVGEERAKAFFERSCAAVEHTLQDVCVHHPNVTPYWAVAEEDGLPKWNNFSTVSQGTGALGDRLHTVAAKLLSKHQSVILMGADSPQICLDTISNAVSHLQESDGALFGPASDGGFYLAGFSQNLPAQTWTSIPYSCEETYAHIKAAFAIQGDVSELNEKTDVDHGSDLPNLLDELAQLPQLNAGQEVLRDYVQQLLQVFRVEDVQNINRLGAFG